MEAITRWNRWANAHTNFFTYALRLSFGAFLFFKGVIFLNDTEYLYNIFKIVSGKGSYYVLVYYVAFTHVCGGFLIMFGLLTRLCALIQMPVLAGAVAINFMGLMYFTNLLQAVTLFFISAFFLFYGSGKHSIDHTLRLHA